MTPRLARALVSLYPRKWQDRYGEEFVGFLQEHPGTPRTLINVIVSAVHEYFRARRDHRFHDSHASVLFMTYALLLAFAAATNLYWTVDDSSFPVLMQSDSTLALCWFAMTGGGLCAFLAAVVCGVPIFLGIAAAVQTAARRTLTSELLMIVSPYVVTFCWFAGVLLTTGGRWAPMPWAVNGNENGWPDFHTRWICASASLLLLIASLGVTARGVRRILRLAHNRNVRFESWAKLFAFAIAISVVLMAFGCSGWGLFLGGVPSFYGQPGILNTSAFDSWLISCGLFAGSVITAALGMKRIFSSQM